MSTQQNLVESRTVPPPFRPRRLLLAEDNADLRLLLGQILRRDGYMVFEFSDGTKLLDYLGSTLLHSSSDELPSLLISDIRMPGANGLDIVTGLRRANWKVPVILMSAFDDQTIRLATEDLGRAVLFHKPFDFEDLRAAVLFMLSRNRN